MLQQKISPAHPVRSRPSPQNKAKLALSIAHFEVKTASQKQS